MLDTDVPIIEVESSATMSYWLSLSMITISYIRLAVSGCAASLSSLSLLVSPLINVEASPCGNRGTAVRRSRVSEVILPDHLISLVFIGSTNNFLFG